MAYTINVNINAPELSSAIQALAATLLASKSSPSCDRCESTEAPEQSAIITNEQVKAVLEKTVEQTAEPEAEADPVKEEPVSETNVTLEQVRAKLAALSQAGKQAQVKKLITDFGATKLTEIPAEKYAELLAQAEEI